MSRNRRVATIGRRRAIAGAGGMAAALAAGPAFGQSAPAVKGSGSKVLFGIGLSAPFLPVVPWVDKGIAAKHGVNAEYKIFESGLGGVEAVVAGNGHVCIGSEVNMSRPRLSGGSIVSVARCLVARRDQGIGVGPGIDKPADFKGKTVAVIRTTGADYLLSRFLEKHNLREGTGPEEVKVITVQPAEWIPAIQRGDLNAFFGWEPWLSKLPQIVKGAKVYAWASDDNLYNQWLFTAFREDWAKQIRTSPAPSTTRWPRPPTGRSPTRTRRSTCAPRSSGSTRPTLPSRSPASTTSSTPSANSTTATR